MEPTTPPPARLPFGETVLLWRLHRKLTQRQLAREARVPQPNLSDIERGRREVSLKTVRALALALGVNPGALVDGLPPEQTPTLSRPALERVAEAAALGGTLRDPREKALAGTIRSLVSARLAAQAPGRAKKARRMGRRADRAWIRAASVPSPVLQSLTERTAEHVRRKRP